MKIEVRNIVFPEIPKEATTSPYSARLYIEGTYAAKVEKDGISGHINIIPVDDRGSRLVTWTEAYLRDLHKDLALEPARPLMLPHIIERRVKEHIARPVEKTAGKYMEDFHATHIVYGKPGSSVFSLSLVSPPLRQLLENPLSFDQLAQHIRVNVIPKLGVGEQVLNTNIPSSVLKNAGLKESQYYKCQHQKNGVKR